MRFSRYLTCYTATMHSRGTGVRRESDKTGGVSANGGIRGSPTQGVRAATAGSGCSGIHKTGTYLITFACYGCHMHGDESGSVDREHNLAGSRLIEADPKRALAERQQM